jgi:hypothetical protein
MAVCDAVARAEHPREGADGQGGPCHALSRTIKLGDDVGLGLRAPQDGDPLSRATSRRSCSRLSDA